MFSQPSQSILRTAVSPPANAGAESIHQLDKLRYSQTKGGSIPTAEIRMNLQKTMQDHAAVYRTGESMAEGCVKVDAVVEKRLAEIERIKAEEAAERERQIDGGAADAA